MSDATNRLKVFISYSRADVAFADQVFAALDDLGFDPILDRHDIDVAEAWETRLSKMLFMSDSVVFILTASSAASQVCRWELEEAARMGKRIIPLVPEPLTGIDAPAAAAALNWIYFYPEPRLPGSGFYDGLRKMERALKVNLDWLRYHTRMTEAAAEWRTRGAPEDLLLRGLALREALDWRNQTPSDTTIQSDALEFLNASLEGQERRDAEEQARIAERTQALAERETALEEKAAAERRLRRNAIIALAAGTVLSAIAVAGIAYATNRSLDANDRRADLYAAASGQLADKADFPRAALLALTGDPAATSGLVEPLFRASGNPSARIALERALTSNRLVHRYATEDAIRFIAISDDGRWLAAAVETNAQQAAVIFWDRATGHQVRTAPIAGARYATAIGFHPDNAHVAVAIGEGPVVLVPVEEGDAAPIVPERQMVDKLAFSPDGKRIVLQQRGLMRADLFAELWTPGAAAPDRTFRTSMAWRDLEEPSDEDIRVEISRIPGLNDDQPDLMGSGFTADGNAVLACLSNGAIAAFPLDDAQPPRFIVRAFGSVSDCGFIDHERLIYRETETTAERQYVESTELLVRKPGEYPLGYRYVTGHLSAALDSDLVAADDKGAVSLRITGDRDRLRFGHLVRLDDAVLSGNRVLARGGEHEILEWSIDLPAATRHLPYGGGVKTIALDATGDLVALGQSPDHGETEPGFHAGLWTATDMSPRLELASSAETVAFDVDLDPSGARWLTLSSTGQLRVGQTGSATPEMTLDGVSRAAFFPDGQRIAVLRTKGRGEVFDVATPDAPIAQFGGANTSGHALAVMADDTILTGDNSQDVRAWSLDTDQPQATYPARAWWVRPLGATDLFLSATSYEVSLWTSGGAAPLARISTSVSGLAVSNDGALAAILDPRGSILVLRPQTLTVVQTIPSPFAPDQSPSSIAMSGDGRHIAVVDRQGGVRMIAPDPALFLSARKLVATACARLAAAGHASFTPEDVALIPLLKDQPLSPCGG